VIERLEREGRVIYQSDEIRELARQARLTR
jgi:hypothetical protein